MLELQDKSMIHQFLVVFRSLRYTVASFCLKSSSSVRIVFAVRERIRHQPAEWPVQTISLPLQGRWGSLEHAQPVVGLVSPGHRGPKPPSTPSSGRQAALLTDPTKAASAVTGSFLWASWCDSSLKPFSNRKLEAADEVPSWGP